MEAWSQVIREITLSLNHLSARYEVSNSHVYTTFLVVNCEQL
jgi:hypothetical protein